tara:strand:+ start:2119 stop:2988 length:870 start_codon:yes stop_codon:yes gene_type:complete
MKIVITGGAGFLGYYIANEAIKKKHTVTVIDKNIVNKNKNIHYIKSDFGNKKALSKIIKKDDVIFHLAAISDINDANKSGITTVKENILKTVQLLEVCKNKKIKKFIFASSIYVHSVLGGLYRVSKKSSELFVEEYAKKNKFNFIILRFGSVYGAKQSIKNNISNIVYHAIKKNKLIYSGNKKSSRSFVHVKDVAAACINLLSKKYDNKIVLISGNEVKSITSIMNIIRKKLSINSKLNFQNKKDNHYINNPYSYEEPKETVYKFNNPIDITSGINDVISHLLKKIKKK